MNKFQIRLVFSIILLGSLLAAAQSFRPGTKRWQVKTSVVDHASVKNVSLKKLLGLPNPITAENQAKDDERITKSLNSMKEGDIISTKGWLHLVALENDPEKHTDGDYHIQVCNHKEWGDSCFIVEIPDGDFIQDAVLKDSCTRARNFVKSKLLKGKEPGTSGNVMQSEVYVTITGQLFFDASHLKGNPRGKSGNMKTPMHSYTCWEIHPVTSIRFAPIPK